MVHKDIMDYAYMDSILALKVLELFISNQEITA